MIYGKDIFNEEYIKRIQMLKHSHEFGGYEIEFKLTKEQWNKLIGEEDEEINNETRC